MVPCRSVPVTSEANIQSWTQTDITSRRSLWKNTVRIFSPSQRIYTMEELGRRWHAPRESHPQLFTHIMRYRKRTAGHVLTMTSGDDIHTVHVKSDSDGARKAHPVESLSGVAHPPVCVRTQPAIATSSPESEYYEACAACAEALYVQHLIQSSIPENSQQVQSHHMDNPMVLNATTRNLQASAGEKVPRAPHVRKKRRVTSIRNRHNSRTSRSQRHAQTQKPARIMTPARQTKMRHLLFETFVTDGNH